MRCDLVTPEKLRWMKSSGRKIWRRWEISFSYEELKTDMRVPKFDSHGNGSTLV
jgi:hypothetical protein